MARSPTRLSRRRSDGRRRSCEAVQHNVTAGSEIEDRAAGTEGAANK